MNKMGIYNHKKHSALWPQYLSPPCPFFLSCLSIDVQLTQGFFLFLGKTNIHASLIIFFLFVRIKLSQKAVWCTVLHGWCPFHLQQVEGEMNIKKRKKGEKIKAKVTRRSWACVEKKRGGEKEEKPNGVSAVINSNCEAWEPPFFSPSEPLWHRLRKSWTKSVCVSRHSCVCQYASVCVCVFCEKSCSSLIQSRDLWSDRLVFHAVSLCIHRAKGEAVAPSIRSAPSLIPSNIYTHTLLEPLKYN